MTISKLLIVCLFTILYLNCQTNPFTQGHRLYDIHCGNCHMDDGQGMANLYPPIDSSDYLSAHLDQLSCYIKFGIMDTIMVNGVVYDTRMEGNASLSHTEIANICNYIYHRWYPTQESISELSVSNLLETCTD